MVEVFKTDVQKEEHAVLLIDALRQTFPFLKLNFDLDDCDRILRVEGQEITAADIIEVFGANGYRCSVLES